VRETAISRQRVRREQMVQSRAIFSGNSAIALEHGVNGNGIACACRAQHGRARRRRAHAPARDRTGRMLRS
jgi:hypothetical protein